MKKINIANTDNELYYEKLKNGLEIYFLPNNKVKNYYITYSTRFGSITTEYKVNDNKYIKVPNGIAHFLEHITFKMKDMDATDYYSSLGVFSNAFTSFDITSYEVSGSSYFKESLDYLLHFVNTPYYTKENVEAEKGIIIEETKMFMDDPNTSLIYEMNKSLFHKDKRVNLISGSVSDVKSITLKDIENVYNTFYNPANMFIVITGNFNYQEAMSIIEEYMKNIPKKEISYKIKEVKEPDKVVRNYYELKTSVEIGKVNIGIKIPKKIFKKLSLNEIELNVYLSIIFSSMFGVSSKIKEDLSSGNIITDNIYLDKYATKDHIIINLLAETLYPTRYINLMKDALNNMVVSEADLERKKRVAIGNLILSYDNIDEVNYSISQDIINYNNPITNYYEIYENLNYEVLLDVLSLLKRLNMAIVVLKPKEKNKN